MYAELRWPAGTGLHLCPVAVRLPSSNGGEQKSWVVSFWFGLADVAVPSAVPVVMTASTKIDVNHG